jgi:hypothetical protein
MNVFLISITVMPTCELHVLTLLDPSPVHVILDIVEMELLVLVGTLHFLSCM